MVSKSVAAALVAAVAAAVVFRWDSTAAMKMKYAQDKEGDIIKVGSIERQTFNIKVDDLKLHCWLFISSTQTKNDKPPPVVVAAYGLGVQKDIAMVPFALKIAEEGFAVVLFDYRHWGVSEGMPRHAANPIEEMKDLKAVLQHLHASNGLGGRVDPNRIALYGASLGGGLVLATASSLAQENNKIKNSIKAVVAAIPLVSGRATRAKSLKERGLWEKVQIMWAVLNDLAWSAFSSDAAVYVQLTRPSSAEGVSAMKISDEEYKIWASRTPLEGKKVDGAWENKLAARTIFWLGQFQPDEMVVNYLEVPTLILAGSEDTLCPIEPIRKMVEMHAAKHEKNKITLKEFPWRHFDFISKENFPLLVENTAGFIRQFF